MPQFNPIDIFIVIIAATVLVPLMFGKIPEDADE